MAFDQRYPKKFRGGITFNSKLSFGRVYSHWKSLGEKKEMVPIVKELKEVVERRKNLYPIP
jgi:hypothetical protein